MRIRKAKSKYIDLSKAERLDLAIGMRHEISEFQTRVLDCKFWLEDLGISGKNGKFDELYWYAGSVLGLVDEIVIRYAEALENERA